jgi:hypothetical protein
MKKLFLPFVNRRYVHVAGAAGDFDESEILEYKLKAEEKWAEGKFTDDIKPHCDAAITQLEKQTARVQELNNPDKDNIVNLTWIKSCGLDTDDFDQTTDVCDIEGPELESDSKEYEMTMSQKFDFSVDDEKIRTNMYERVEQVAHGFLKADKQLSEWWTRQIIAYYKANMGPNIPVIANRSSPFTWDAANTRSLIPAASYKMGMVANLIKQMQLNMAESGFYLEDGTFFEEWMNAGLDGGNLDGKGNDLRKSKIDLNFDMWNFTGAGVAENMFLVDRNAVSMNTYTRYTDAPVEKRGKINQTRFRYKSNILPGVYYDVIYTMSCNAGRDIHTWRFITRGGIFLNPTPCPQTIDGTEYTPTGIYGYKVTA